MKASVKIENWIDHGSHLTGNVTGHPRIPDSTEVRTSPIIKRSDGCIETLNTIYILGQPHKEFSNVTQ
jgi:hypothetical protein